MRRRHRSATALTIAIAFLLCWFAGNEVVAHTSVRAAHPGPGEVVSGTVERVELVFLEPVGADPEIDVTGPSGDPVPGLGPTRRSDDGIVVSRSFDPLRAPGSYQVDYRYAAQDGAPQSGSYQFRYQTDGGSGSDGGDTWVVAAVVVGSAVVGFVAWVALRRRRAKSGISAETGTIG